VLGRARQLNYLQTPEADFCCTAYYIAFGPHGPRRPPPPDEGRKVFFLAAGVIAAAVGVFSITRLFANPVRPRTMTKEWQEATEEYMKVRWTRATRALVLFPREPALIPTPTATRNRAHHVQAWHDDPEQVRETPLPQGEAQRRVKVPRHDCVIQTTNTYTSFPWVNFPLVLFVCYTSNQQGCELGGKEPPLGWHCVISPPVYRILDAFPNFAYSYVRRALQVSPCASEDAVYRLPCCFLQSTGSTLCQIDRVRSRGVKLTLQLTLIIRAT